MYSQIVIVWYVEVYLKKKNDAVYTKHIENGVGWNKNICKLSCENFSENNCVFCAIKSISDDLLLLQVGFLTAAPARSNF